MFHVIDQVFDETRHVARSWSFSLPILIFLSSFFFLLIAVSLILHTLLSVFISFLCSYDIMCGHPYVALQWYWFIVVDFFITCSGYFRLSVYTWGIFHTYICRRLSSRFRFHAFWEVGRDSKPTSTKTIRKN